MGAKAPNPPPPKGTRRPAPPPPPPPKKTFIKNINLFAILRNAEEEYLKIFGKG